MTNAVDILRLARERINSPSKWVSHWSISEDGKRICAATAIERVAGGNGPVRSWPLVAQQALKALAAESGVSPQWTDYDRVAWLNSLSHRAVMAAFDRAIERTWEAILRRKGE